MSNVTPNNVHLEVMLAVLRAGKPLMTEKPMTLDAAEAETALAAAREAGVPVMLGFTYRFYPAMRYARHIVRAGSWGKSAMSRPVQAGGRDQRKRAPGVAVQ